MSRIKSKGTNFENQIFREIRKSGIRFQKNYKGAIGKPDIALPRQRKAVFLHSDFWHGWRLPQWEAILPNDFWKEKIRKNRVRDRKVLISLRRNGWKTLVVWEHQIKTDRESILRRITDFLRPDIK